MPNWRRHPCHGLGTNRGTPPQLPEEADGALWQDVRAVRQQNISNADLVAMILRMADELERGDNA